MFWQRSRQVVLNTLLAASVAAVVLLVVWTARRTEQAGDSIVQLADSQARLSQELTDREERIIELPDDSKIYHVSLFLHDDWRARSRDRTLVAWWASEPRLLSLRAQVHWHVYTPSHATYQARFTRTVPVLPAVMLQDASGLVLYKASGEALPSTAEEMGGLLSRIWQNRPYYVFPWRRPKPCPEPCPEPEPEPKPRPEPEPEPLVPDVLPPGPDGFPWGLLAIVVALGGAGSLVWQFRRGK